MCAEGVDGKLGPVKVLGAALVLAVGLACSACSSLFLAGAPSGGSGQAVTTVTTPPETLQQLPLKRSGYGIESLGRFALHGNVHVRARCSGNGTVKIDFFFPPHSRHGAGGAVGIGPAPCQGNATYAINSVGNEGVNSHIAEIEVEAPASTKWRIDIVDRQPKF